MVLYRPEIAIEIVNKSMWKTLLANGYFYVGYEVEKSVWDAHDIGSVYQGGTVAEAIMDHDLGNDTWVILVRYGCPEHKANKKRARKWQDRKDAGL